MLRSGFPFIALISTVVGWFFVTDFISNGGTWTYIVSLAIGLLYLLAGSVSRAPACVLAAPRRGPADRRAAPSLVAHEHVRLGAHLGGGVRLRRDRVRDEALELGGSRHDRLLRRDDPLRRRLADPDRRSAGRSRRRRTGVLQHGARAAVCHSLGPAAPSVVLVVGARVRPARPLARPARPRRPAPGDRCASRVARRLSPRYHRGVEKPLRIGVLAVQGNFREHAAVLRRLGAEPVEVRLPEQLEGLDGLIIPGGESTTIAPADAAVRARRRGARVRRPDLRDVRGDDRPRPRPPRPRRLRDAAQRVRPPGARASRRISTSGTATSRCAPSSSARRGSRTRDRTSRCSPRSTAIRCWRARDGSSSPPSIRS